MALIVLIVLKLNYLIQLLISFGNNYIYNNTKLLHLSYIIVLLYE